MRKKIVSISVIIIACVALSGCHFLWIKYKNKDKKFSILFSRFWTIEENKGPLDVVCHAPLKGKNDLYRENINVIAAELPNQDAVDTFFQMNKDVTMRVLPGLKSNVSEGEIFAGSHRGQYFSFETSMEDHKIKIKSAVFFKGLKAYIVTCSAQTSQYHKYKDVFEKSIKSLRIK
ncbi:MAG: hypothetical protein GY858_06130 [Candidatus Omnitrophica bacterium]|nr:hypothetical protein [Candidatus Omnitrophota bacterium]